MNPIEMQQAFNDMVRAEDNYRRELVNEYGWDAANARFDLHRSTATPALSAYRTQLTTATIKYNDMVELTDE